MHILLLNDNSHINSFGCQATIAALRQMLAESFPQAEIRSLDQDYITQKRHPMVRLLRLLGCEREPFPVVANEFPEYGHRWMDARAGPAGRDFLPLLHWADLVIHNAELLNYCHNRIGYRCAFLVWLARAHLGKSAAMINQTAPAPGSDMKMEGILEFVCPQLDLVTAREPRSQQALRRLGVEAALVPDPVFALAPDFSTCDKVEAWKRSQGLDSPYVCLSFTSVRKVAHESRTLGALIETVDAIAQTGRRVVLLHGGDAGRIARALSSRTHTAIFRGNVADFWSLLKGAECLVSGHYHNMIMAAMVGCPFVPFRSVSHKVQSFCEMLEYPLAPLNPTALADKTECIRSNLEQVLRDRHRLSQQLLQRAGQLKDEARRTGLLLQGLQIPSGGSCRR